LGAGGGGSSAAAAADASIVSRDVCSALTQKPQAARALLAAAAARARYSLQQQRAFVAALAARARYSLQQRAFVAALAARARARYSQQQQRAKGAACGLWLVALHTSRAMPPTTRSAIKKTKKGAKQDEFQDILRGVLDELDDEAEKGNVNSGAHVRLMNSLKKLYDAKKTTQRLHVEGFLVDALSEDPFGMGMVPMDYREIVEQPRFWRSLLARTRELSETNSIEKDWWSAIMSGFLPSWATPNYDDDGSLLVLLRVSVHTLLRVKSHTMRPMIERLDQLELQPSELFPFKFDLETFEGPCVLTVVDADPRFIGWLLQDGHGYDREEVKAIREFAFRMADGAVQRDRRFQKALGLRGVADVLHVSLSMTLGMDFEDAITSAHQN